MKRLRLNTSKGSFDIELFDQDAPMTTKMILSLVKKKKYNGIRIQEVEEGYLTQTEGLDIPEASKISKAPVEIGAANHHHDSGTVAVLHHESGQGRLFFSHNRETTHHLDNKHTIIGRITDGLEVLPFLQPGDTIERVNLA